MLVADQSLQAIAENEFYIVISHDCDVTNRSLEIEASVELLKGKLLLPKEKDGRGGWTCGSDWWIVYWFIASMVAAFCVRPWLNVNI